MSALSSMVPMFAEMIKWRATDMTEGRCYDGNCVIADYGATCADGCVNFLETEHTGSWDRRQLAGGFIDNSEPGMLNVRQECDAHRTWTTILIVIVVVGVVALLGTIGAIIGCLVCCGCIKKKSNKTGADQAVAA